jgi:hypothetical protein
MLKYKGCITTYTHPSTNERKRKSAVTRGRFVGRITKMGDKYIIIIPKEGHEQAEKLKGKQVRVLYDDEFW